MLNKVLEYKVCAYNTFSRANGERWLSGLKCWSRKLVDGNVSRVQIPLSPP